jgi:hypothetical protein
MGTDLKDRFAAADRIDAPDLWAEARRRSRSAAVPAPVDPFGPRVPWNRIATVSVAFAVFASAVVFAWNVATPDDAAHPLPAADLGSELPVGWSELPAPPEVRTDAATVWTGSELLVWGGHRYEGFGEGPLARGGLTFDAASRRWGTFPHGPLSARRDPAAVWTGNELLVWGGSTGECCLPTGEGYLSDGAAYDPRAGTWRALSPAPIDGRVAFSVWTGDELLVWGNAEWGFTLRDGAAYDPGADAWRTIAEAPVDINDGSAVWTGEEMIVFGAARRSGTPLTETAIGIAYSPASDRWRELPPSELSPNAMTAEWLGDELVAWDYLNASQAYDPATERWRALGRVPLDPAECPPNSVSTSRMILGDYCGSTVAFSQEDGRWRQEPLPIGGCCRLNELVPAGDVILVLSSAVERESLEPGARRLFAYNPREVSASDPLGQVAEPEPFLPPTERDGDRFRMPIVFPDGAKATVVFPAELGLDRFGVQPDVSYVWRDDPPPRYPIVFLHDRNASIERFVDQQDPTRLVNTSCGGMEVWRASGNDVERRFWIRYELPSWTVLVSVRDALESAVGVHCALRIVETDQGFPVVEAGRPLSLAEGFGESAGAQLSFGDAAAEPDAVSQFDATIFLSPDGCAPGSEVTGTYGSTCLAGGNVFASIYGDRDFVNDVIAGLRVEAFRPGPEGVT